LLSKPVLQLEVLGIEIGSSKIRGAIVDVQKGELLTKITSLDPDKKLEPHKLVSSIHKMAKKMDWKGPIGCTFPAPIRKGVVLRTDKVHESWEDVDAEHLFSEITNVSVKVVNYSDAVGIAEMEFGSGNSKNGTVLVLTIEDEIGSSLFYNGQLIPNMELGQIELRGISVQDRASSKVRKEEGISSKQWAARIHYILENYERIFHPELFIIGGKASKKANKIFPYINVNTKIKSTTFMNEAGIVGAALFACKSLPAAKLKMKRSVAG
jgi:polyphosphate glucokinase